MVKTLIRIDVYDNSSNKGFQSLDVSFQFKFLMFILGNTIGESAMYRELQAAEKYRGGQEDIRYISAEDLQALAMEVAEKLVSEVTSDQEIVSVQQRVSVAELLFNELAR